MVIRRPAIPPSTRSLFCVYSTIDSLLIILAFFASRVANNITVELVFRANRGKTEIPREQFPRSILMTSSSTRPTRAASSRGCYEDVARVGRLPVQLATRLPDWSAGGLFGVVLPVCPCVVSFSKFHEPDTHNMLRTSSRRSLWHPRPTRPIFFVTC